MQENVMRRCPDCRQLIAKPVRTMSRKEKGPDGTYELRVELVSQSSRSDLPSLEWMFPVSDDGRELVTEFTWDSGHAVTLKFTRKIRADISGDRYRDMRRETQSREELETTAGEWGIAVTADMSRAQIAEQIKLAEKQHEEESAKR